jgi:hypothetical protein
VTEFYEPAVLGETKLEPIFSNRLEFEERSLFYSSHWFKEFCI